MAGNNHDNKHWDITITSGRGRIDFNFRELWHYRDLLMMFVKKDIITVYKQTILGPAWFVLQPILTTAIFVFVFGNIAKIGTDGVPPILFYLGDPEPLEPGDPELGFKTLAEAPFGLGVEVNAAGDVHR